MACLCAPTTHEGSFRCRLHRGIPLVTNSAQLAANHLKGASHEISDRLCSISARNSPSTASQAIRDSHKSSSPSPSVRPAASSSSSSSLLPFRYSRPPPSKRAISSSRSPCLGSLTSSEASATRCPSTAPNISHVAALAIMKQHLHNKHIKSHGNRNFNSSQRSSAAYKIGPSRLSRMARAACTDEVPALKKADCCIPDPPPQSMLWLKSSSFNSDAPQERGLTSMEATPIKIKMHPVLPKFKQSESSCKIVDYKPGPFIVSTVY